MKLRYPYKYLALLSVVVVMAFFVLLQTYTLKQFTTYPLNGLLLKSLGDSLIALALVLLMWRVIPQSGLVKLSYSQRIINSIALGVLFLILWTVLISLSSMLFLGINLHEQVNTFSLYTILIGTFIYVINLQAINISIYKSEFDDKDGCDERITDEDSEYGSSDNGVDNELPHQMLDRIAVKVGQKIHIIAVPDIVYIQADGDYVQIFTNSGKYTKEGTMKYFQNSLPNTQFVRVHRSYIVNVEKIQHIELYDKQNQILTVSNGDNIKASVSGYKVLKDVLSL
ncbi:MAG: LytR/AlgR family response regulator transcription factor [Fermentimonas sp.]|jgi:hypothetical protein